MSVGNDQICYLLIMLWHF